MGRLRQEAQVGGYLGLHRVRLSKENKQINNKLTSKPEQIPETNKNIVLRSELYT